MTIATIADIVRTYARERPDAPAFEYDGRTVTFARPRRALEPSRQRADGRRRARRAPRRLPRQEQRRVLRAHVRAHEDRRGHRLRELAVGRRGGRADRQRRQGRRHDRGRGVRVPGREDRADARDRVDLRRHRWARLAGTTTRRSLGAHAAVDPDGGVARRRRRAPALHVGHDGSAQGRDAHQRQLLLRDRRGRGPRGSSHPVR